MKKLKVILQVGAIDDINEIWFYTYQNWSLKQANRYLELIYEEIDHIASNPSHGKVISGMTIEYLSVKVKSHIIFYTFSTEKLIVVRILHESMDIPTRLID